MHEQLRERLVRRLLQNRQCPRRPPLRICSCTMREISSADSRAGLLSCAASWLLQRPTVRTSARIRPNRCNSNGVVGLDLRPWRLGRANKAPVRSPAPRNVSWPESGWRRHARAGVAAARQGLPSCARAPPAANAQPQRGKRLARQRKRGWMDIRRFHDGSGRHWCPKTASGGREEISGGHPHLGQARRTVVVRAVADRSEHDRAITLRGQPEDLVEFDPCRSPPSGKRPRC